ncbi:MAG: hypothetical protein J4F31_07805 [Flavobacteriales bacterium]|nr:hypothetical protein [Flavobacteriales bacterium]
MDAARLLGWIAKPWNLDASAAKELNEIIDSFPYFVGARMLHLKALENTSSFRYNGQLKKTAAHSPDRTALFEFITAKPIAPQAQEAKQQPQLQQQNELTEQYTGRADLIPEPEPLERQLEDVLEENDDAVEIEDAIREDGDGERVIGRPLKFDRTERHSFAEWLKLTSMKPIERQEEKAAEEIAAEPISTEHESFEQARDTKSEETEEKRRSLSRQDLIDRFLAESPRMSLPQKHALGKGNVAKSSLDEDDSLMTETLARVYSEQGLYKKAVKAYRLLSLKYPEKSGYFADRINEINDLKERK